MADDLVKWTCRNCGERLTMLPKDPGFLRHPSSVTCWSSGNVVRAVDAVRTDEIERLRAENEALRTVTEEDASAAAKSYRAFMGDLWELPAPGGMLHVLQSFIRSKGARRG